MTDEQPSSHGVADAQAAMNARIGIPSQPTAEERYATADDATRRQADGVGLDVAAHKPVLQQATGAAVLTILAGSFAFLATQGRLGELGAHTTLVLPFGLLLATYAATLLLPVQAVASIFGGGSRYPRTYRGQDHAGIIQKDGDLQLVPIRGPAVLTKKPSLAIYDAYPHARVRVTKTIRAGTYLTLFNQGNPEPVNAQSIRGYTAEFVYNLTGGLSSIVNGAWAAAIGLAPLNRKRLLLLVGALVLAYVGYQWYQDGGF